MIIMKIILTILTFFLSGAYGLELKETQVALPLGVPQLDTSPLKKGEKELTYKVELYQNVDGSLIRPRATDNKSIEKFMQSLVYAYKSQDLELFKSLISEKSLQSFDTDSQKFKDSFKFLEKIKKPHVKYAFAYKDGVIVAWSAIGLNSNRILFLKKEGNFFQMHRMDIKQDDHLFWNMGLYFKFAPFDSYGPKDVKVGTFDGQYKITANTHEFKNFLHIYSPSKKKMKVVSVGDNYPNNRQYKDYDLDPRSIEIKIGQKDLKEMGKELRIVETSWPISYITEAVHKRSLPLKLP